MTPHTGLVLVVIAWIALIAYNVIDLGWRKIRRNRTIKAQNQAIRVVSDKPFAVKR